MSNSLCLTLLRSMKSLKETKSKPVGKFTAPIWVGSTYRPLRSLYFASGNKVFLSNIRESDVCKTKD